jgi:Fe-S-cluster-containing dehydrogenase component
MQSKKEVLSMTNNILLVDVDKCTRCYACEIACRQEHDLSFETKSRWCRVMTIEPRWIKAELYMDFVPYMCFQCDDPPCAYFCPVNAISKREDGIVVVDEETCTGCKLCIYGCPYGLMFYNEVKGTAGKCDLCIDRIDNGLEPSCVKHCIGGAIQFVTPTELANITRGQHTTTFGKVVYTSSKWRLSRDEYQVEG